MFRFITTLCIIAFALNTSNVDASRNQRQRKNHTTGHRLRSLNNKVQTGNPIISPDAVLLTNDLNTNDETRKLKKGKKEGFYGGNTLFGAGPKKHNKGGFGLFGGGGYDPKWNKKGKKNKGYGGYNGYNNGGLFNTAGYSNNNYSNYNNGYNRPRPNIGAILGIVAAVGVCIMCCAVKICTGCLV